MYPKCLVISFNSTLVQLKVEGYILSVNGAVMFQFYLSSIKRGYTKFVAEYGFKFQFYLSSIKSFNMY